MVQQIFASSSPRKKSLYHFIINHPLFVLTNQIYCNLCIFNSFFFFLHFFFSFLKEWQLGDSLTDLRLKDVYQDMCRWLLHMHKWYCRCRCSSYFWMSLSWHMSQSRVIRYMCVQASGLPLSFTFESEGCTSTFLKWRTLKLI